MTFIKKYWQLLLIIPCVLLTYIIVITYGNARYQPQIKEQEKLYKQAQDSINQLQKERNELIIQAFKYQIKADSAESLAIRYSKNQTKTKLDFEKVIVSVDTFSDSQIIEFWNKRK